MTDDQGNSSVTTEIQAAKAAGGLHGFMLDRSESLLKIGTVHLEGWAWRTEIPVEIIGETPKRTRVRFLKTAYRWRAGDVALVPKHAVTTGEEARDAS